MFIVQVLMFEYYDKLGSKGVLLALTTPALIIFMITLWRELL